MKNGVFTSINNIKSYAKINLFLDVTGVDSADGYHYIDSLFQEVTLYDEIEIKRHTEDNTLFQNEDIPAENTVSKALRLFKEKYQIDDSFSIKIVKNIPIGAGLGGGSSNAAAVLTALAKAYRLPMAEIIEIGRKIGSDVPFFFTGGLCRVRGKGEKVESLDIKLENMAFLIIYPMIHISTGWAYSLINDKEKKYDLEKFLNKTAPDIDFLKKIVYNKLQLFVFNNCQELADIKKRLDGFLDSRLSFMSGSGSSLVYVYTDSLKAQKDLTALKSQSGYKAFLCGPYYRRTR